MKVDGPLIIRKVHEDFYVIEKENHNNESRVIPIADAPPGSGAWFRDSWISTSCVEGSTVEMLGIAKAIKNRGSYSAKRCAVLIEDGFAYFYSPRNSWNMGWMPPDGDPRGKVMLKFADQLADLIKEELNEM